MMNCKKCGEPLHNEYVNCPYCGAGITEEERSESRKQDSKEAFDYRQKIMNDYWQRKQRFTVSCCLNSIGLLFFGNSFFVHSKPIFHWLTFIFFILLLLSIIIFGFIQKALFCPFCNHILFKTNKKSCGCCPHCNNQLWTEFDA